MSSVRSVVLNLTPLYARFLEQLPAGGSILDAGCGSGRDTRAFLEDAGLPGAAIGVFTQRSSAMM
jgi:ubiquinone/menaquinone biosynthesis C-methylase UbiE